MYVQGDRSGTLCLPSGVAALPGLLAKPANHDEMPAGKPERTKIGAILN